MITAFFYWRKLYLMSKKIRIQAELDDSKLRKKLDDIGKRKEKITVDVDSGNIENTDQSMKHLNRTVSDSNSVFGRLKSTISNTFSSGKLATTGYLLALNEINKAARNAKVTINDMDEAVTNLSIAMGKGRNEAYSYLGELNKQAKELGAKTKETADSADSWIRQGKNIAETEKLVRDSMVLSKLGKIESADASEYLTASLNGYKKSASEAIDIVDKLTAVDMESASDAGGLAVSLSKTASAANMAEVSFDRLVGMIATVKEVTQDSDESVGNMFKSTFSRMNQIKAGKFIDAETGESLNDVEKVLNKVGIAMRDANGEFISSEKIMDAVGSKWEEFDSTTQRAVATAMAGTYQYNKLIALFENYSKALQYTEVAADSAGTAMQKFNDSFLGSLEAKQNSLQASFESAIMNNDFSEVYGGILDATTVLVDFINQTNALKGALAGLTVAGGIKAFLTIKTGITEAYVALNKFQNALDITKKIGISTSEYERLLLLSNGLSASQMKLVLSTNSLTLAQKQELLMASGLSAEEAALQLETWGMTAANTGLTAATTTLGNAFKGLWATLVANPLIVVTAAVSAAVMAYQTYNQKLEETRRENIDNATAASEHANELRKQYDEYMRLASIQDKTTSQEEEFKTAVDNIIASLGSKADALKDLTVGTDEYASALARATKEELQSQAVNATVGRKSAEEEFQGSFWDDWKGSKVSVDSNDKGKSLSDEAQKAVNIVRDSLKEYETINRTWKNISWDISSDDPTEALEYYKSLVEAREKLVIASGDDEALLNTELYEDLNTAINTMSESLDTYIEKLYEEQKLNYMAQNGIPTTTEEYSAMEEAITGAAGSSETLQNKFQDLLMTDFAPLINEVEEVEKTVDSVASGMADPSLSISQTIDQLNTQLKPAFDSLKSAYQDIFTDDGFTLENVDTSMLSSIKSAIDELNKMEDVDINVDYSSFENLAKVLADSSSTAEDVQNSFNNFASTILDAVNPAISQCDGESYKLLQTLLESMGIVNAEEVLMAQLGYSYEEYANAKESAANAGIDLNNSIDSVATALQNEGLMATEDAQQIMNYMLAKMSASGATIDVSSTIGQLAEEFSWLADLIDQWGLYYSVSKKGSGSGNVKGSKNLGVGNYTPTQTTKVKQKVEIEPVFDGNKANRAAKSVGSKAGKSYKDGLKEQLSDLDSVISGITGRIDDNIEAVRTQKEEAVAAIDAQIDALNEQKSALEDQKKALEEARDAAVESLEEERDARIEVIEQQKKQLELAIKAIDKQIKQKEKVIKGIQDEINSLKNANEQRKLQLNLQREQYELERLQHQRTILQYSEDLGMHYVTNTKDIRNQKDKVDDAKLEIEIAKKQQQIDLIEKEIDLLNEKKEAINEQIDLLDEEIEKINDFYDKEIEKTKKFYDGQIKAIDAQIESIDKQIEALQKQREQTEKYYDSLIENMEKSKSKYEELTEILEKAELSAKLKQLGIDEEALLNGSEEEFEKLKNAYMNVVTQLNAGNDEVLSALHELSGYDGTAPSMLEESNTKLGTMNDELGNANKEVGNVNSSLGETASTTGDVATNVSDVNTNIGETTGLVNEEKGAFDELKRTIDLIVEAINKKIQAIEAGQNTVATAVGSEMANFQLLINKILEVKEKLDAVNDTVATMNRQPIDNLTSAFQLLYDKLLLVSNLLGVSMEGEGEGAVSGISGAIQALNEISLEEGIIAQFTMLKEAIDSVTAAISGGGGKSSEGEGSGSGSGSNGGKSGGKGSADKGESGGGNSLTGAIKEMGDTAQEVIGEPDAEGDGTVIGEFGSMETAVNDVRDAIGTEGSEGGEGGKSGSGGESDDTLVGSIEYLGDKTEEEMGELDGEGILGKFNEFKCVIEEAANQVKSISEGLDEIDGKEVECTITINVKMNGSIPHFASGTVLGNMQIESATYNAKYGKAFASGTIGLRHDEKNALRSEYGQPELTVYPNGMTELTTSPVMSDLPKGTVIYNEEETKKIMDNKSNSVGNAHANGTDDGIWTTLADGTRVRELQPGDRMYDMMQKFDAYFNSMDGNIEKLVPNSVYEHQRQMEDMAKQINYVSSVVNNNRNVQQPVHNEIHITCPGVTSKEVAQQVGVELNNMFNGLHLEAMQQSMIRK